MVWKKVELLIVALLLLAIPLASAASMQDGQYKVTIINVYADEVNMGDGEYVMHIASKQVGGYYGITEGDTLLVMQPPFGNLTPAIASIVAGGGGGQFELLAAEDPEIQIDKLKQQVFFIMLFAMLFILIIFLVYKKRKEKRKSRDEFV